MLPIGRCDFEEDLGDEEKKNFFKIYSIKDMYCIKYKNLTEQIDIEGDFANSRFAYI